MDLQNLERRRFFSVTVTEGYPGFYEIDGDNSHNNIAVSVSQTDNTFTPYGVTYPDAWFISVHTGSGDDTISLTSVDGDGGVGAGIDSGGGNDTISLNFDGAVYAGNGDDVLYLADSFRGEAYGESGNDQMYISGACVDAEIQGGSGDDLIDCSANEYSVVVHGGTGNDTIIGSEYDDQIYGDAGTDSLVGGGGNDSFYSRDGSNDYIDGGSGTDVVYANGTESSIVNVEYVYYS